MPSFSSYRLRQISRLVLLWYEKASPWITLSVRGGVTIYRDFLATDHISIEIAIPIFFDNRCLKFGFFLHNEPTRLFRDFHWFFLGKKTPLDIPNDRPTMPIAKSPPEVSSVLFSGNPFPCFPGTRCMADAAVGNLCDGGGVSRRKKFVLGGEKQRMRCLMHKISLQPQLSRVSGWVSSKI